MRGLYNLDDFQKIMLFFPNSTYLVNSLYLYIINLMIKFFLFYLLLLHYLKDILNHLNFIMIISNLFHSNFSFL